MRAKTAGVHVGVRKAPGSGLDAGVQGPFPAAAFSCLRLASIHCLIASVHTVLISLLHVVQKWLGGNVYTPMWQLWQMWQFRQLWHKRIYKLKGAIVANVANVANQDE